jgi:hypothetical protein
MKFKVGDKAYKPKGYKFPCTIVSVFTTTSGEVRIVGEMEDNGMLHIFNENQLEHLFDHKTCEYSGLPNTDAYIQ